MRNFQVAQAESEDDDDADPMPDPDLWKSSSAHDTVPYPSMRYIIDNCWEHQFSGIPKVLKPEGPSTCHCGEPNEYVKVKEACRILYPAPHSGHRRQLYKLRCANGHTIVDDGTEHGLFHISDESCVSLWLLY